MSDTNSSRMGPGAEFVRELALWIDNLDDNGLDVISTLVDANSVAPSMLKSLMEGSGGVYIDADLSAYESAVQLDSRNAALEEAIKRALTVSAGWTTRTLQIVDTDAGLTDVQFAELAGRGAGSEAELSLLRLARAFLDPRLLTARHAIVRYREAGLDAWVIKAAWSLAGQLLGIKLGAIRGLAVLVEIDGSVLIDPHCAGPNGFRFAHTGDRLLVRNTPAALSGHASHFLSSPNVFTLFLGAGFSASSGLPMGDSLRDVALRNLIGVASEDVASEALPRHFAESHEHMLTAAEKADKAAFSSRLTFERALLAEHQEFPLLPTLQVLRDREIEVLPEPGLAVRSLHDLIRSGRRMLIATVNLDRLIEHDVSECVRVFATEAEFAGAATYIRDYIDGRESRVPVLKLHGTIDDFESCVVTARQTMEGISPSKADALAAMVGTVSARRPWIYVGASMRDLDLNPEFQRSQFAAATSEYWVAPYLATTVEEFAIGREAIWATDPSGRQSLQQRLISARADEFMAELARANEAAL